MRSCTGVWSESVAIIEVAYIKERDRGPPVFRNPGDEVRLELSPGHGIDAALISDQQVARHLVPGHVQRPVKPRNPFLESPRFRIDPEDTPATLAQDQQEGFSYGRLKGENVNDSLLPEINQSGLKTFLDFNNGVCAHPAGRRLPPRSQQDPKQGVHRGNVSQVSHNPGDGLGIEIPWFQQIDGGCSNQSVFFGHQSERAGGFGKVSGRAIVSSFVNLTQSGTSPRLPVDPSTRVSAPEPPWVPKLDSPPRFTSAAAGSTWKSGLPASGRNPSGTGWGGTLASSVELLEPKSELKCSGWLPSAHTYPPFWPAAPGMMLVRSSAILCPGPSTVSKRPSSTPASVKAMTRRLGSRRGAVVGCKAR